MGYAALSSKIEVLIMQPRIPEVHEIHVHTYTLAFHIPRYT